MGKIIAIVNQKGGVGKTTTCVNLAAAVQACGKKVLLCDFDPQANATSGMGVDKSTSNGVYDVLINGVEPEKAIVSTRYGDVLPSSKALAGAGVEMIELEDRQFLLKKALAQVADRYDFIFIDCPPLEIVADATICARLATMTLFVIRAEALQRTALPDVQKYYDEKRLPKMTVLLNGTTDAFSRYGNHRYGARYGYAYGSGGQYSSYGYGEDDDEKETSKKKK